MLCMWEWDSELVRLFMVRVATARNDRILAGLYSFDGDF